MGPANERLNTPSAMSVVGGRYAGHMKSPAGEGTTSVARLFARSSRTKSSFLLAWQRHPERESVVTVLLKPDGDGTLLTLTHEHSSTKTRANVHQGGWNGALDKMEKFVGGVTRKQCSPG